MGNKYTNLTYQDIYSTMLDIVHSDDKFKNFTDADISSLMMQLMAGTTDYNNFNIERVAEEQFYNTGKRMRGHVKLANNQGYDIKRPIPAQTKIKFEITKDSGFPLSNAIPTTETRVIKIPQYTDFSYNGKKFILKDAVEYTLNAQQLVEIAEGGKITIDSIVKSTTTVHNLNDSSITSETSEIDDITLVQGEFRVIKIVPPAATDTDSSGNDKFPLFQKYIIEDPTFSNYYGEYDMIGGSTTLVGIGETEADAFSIADNMYTIERKTLLQGKSLNAIYQEGSSVLAAQNIVLVRTSAEAFDGFGVELRFGDGVTVSKGVANSSDNVYVRYLSTDGKSANETGVLGDTVSIINEADWIQKADMKLKAILVSNITGGSDMESLDSIAVSAPGMYQTFDRLVSHKDHYDYLKSLTSPIVVKNAVSWGEQEELENLNYLATNGNKTFQAIKKLSNVILFTVLGDLYETTDNTTSLRLDIDDQVLDAGYSNYQIPGQSYINLFAFEDIVAQVKFQQNSFNGSIPIRTSFINSSILSRVMISGSDKFLQAIDQQTFDIILEFTPESADEDVISIKQNFTYAELFTFAPNTETWSNIILSIENNMNDMARTVLGTTLFQYFQLSSNLEKDVKYWNYNTDSNGDIIDPYSVNYQYLKIEGNYFNDTTHKFKDINIKFNIKWLDDDIYKADKADIGADPFKFENMNTFKAVEQNTYPGLVLGDKINQMISYIKPKSQITEQPIYISPVIHDFALTGKVNIKNLVNLSEISDSIKNATYSFLSNENDFAKELYLSNIIEVIESFGDVISANIKLEPLELVPILEGQVSHLDWDRLKGYSHYIFNNINLDTVSMDPGGDAYTIKDSIINSINNYLIKYNIIDGTEPIITIEDLKTIYNAESLIGPNKDIRNLSDKISSGITERSFMYELVKPLMDDLSSINTLLSSERAGAPLIRTPEFYMLVSDIHNDFKDIIKFNMISEDGNIAADYKSVETNGVLMKVKTRGGYTINNEIVRVRFDAEIGYKD